MKVSHLHSLFFLCLVVLIIYYPAVSGIYNTVDDVHIIDAYGHNGHQTLKHIFIPGNQYYFRPLIELTYYFDNWAWGLNPSSMHLENILLHILNVILVYLIASNLKSWCGYSSALPFISALLFAIHPINTEAVCWIAGRTDPLAAVFILLSVLFLVRFFQKGVMKDYYLYLAFMLISFLAKETSIMLLPASFVMFYSVQKHDLVYPQLMQRMRSVMVLQFLLLFVILSAYVWVRIFGKPVGTDNAVSILFHTSRSFYSLLFDFLASTGFYVKKIILPLPLNFAINSVNGWYALPGIAAVGYFVYSLINRNILVSFLLTGLLFILPALAVNLAGIGWTAVSERYLYIPTAFLSIWGAVYIVRAGDVLKKKSFVFGMALFAIIASAAAYVTFERNIIWQSNLSLFEDTVKKSPMFGDAHNELAIALANNGEYDKAINHFQIAEKLSTRPEIRELAGLNLLKIELQGKDNIQKRIIIKKYIESHDRVSLDILKTLRNISMNVLIKEADNTQRELLIKEIMALNDKMYQKVKDPIYLYNNGKLMMSSGDTARAAKYFSKVIEVASPAAHYFLPSKTLLNKLEK